MEILFMPTADEPHKLSQSVPRKNKKSSKKADMGIVSPLRWSTDRTPDPYHVVLDKLGGID